MRIEQITFTRFIAALLIVLYHFGRDLPLFGGGMHFLILNANTGVSYFYLLSGFIMVVAYSNHEKINAVNYIQNRFARVYPVYIIALAVMFVVKMTMMGIDYRGLFLSTTMLQSWIPGKALSYNFPGWSISVEFFFYVLFPLLFNYLYRKFSWKQLLIPILTIWAISQIAFHYLLYSPFYKGDPSVSHQFLFYFPPMHLSQFLIGNLAGLFFMKYSKYGQRNFDIPIVLLVTAMLLVLKYPFGMNFHNGLLAVFAIPFIVLLAFNNGLITKIFNKPPLIYLGEISYSMYILQLPVFLLLKNYDLGSPTLAFFIKLSVLILLSSLSYTYVEAPMRQKIKAYRLPVF
jgi:peptidoglycan/LPS O-acetylase OafA/YrhL